MSRGWAYVASAFIVIVPLLQELLAVKKQLAKNKKRNIVNDSSSSSGYSNNGAEIEEETDKEKIPKQENIVQDWFYYFCFADWILSIAAVNFLLGPSLVMPTSLSSSSVIVIRRGRSISFSLNTSEYFSNPTNKIN